MLNCEQGYLGRDIVKDAWVHITECLLYYVRKFIYIHNRHWSVFQGLQIEDWYDQNYKKWILGNKTLVRKNKQEATEKMKTRTKKTAMGMKRKGMEINFLSSKTQLYMFIPMSTTPLSQ